ncbi:hypothetical protein Mapa_012540 [Marchantia paleacea]|nr:hypothetical protein Mapa_012540 [Marchantia paleacea]
MSLCRTGDHVSNISKVELFSIEGTKLELQASNISLQGSNPSDTSPCETISRILNGVVNTTREKNMWMCPLPPAGDPPLEIHIQVPGLDLIPGHMRIWNYNRSIGETTKGVREMQVYVDRELIWQGMVGKGCGNRVFDYSSRIPLLDEAPLSATSSTIKVQSSSAYQETHFVSNAPDVENKVPDLAVSECALFSVGTSFTFSPIEGSSSPSSCGSLISASSPLEGRSLLTATSELSGQDRGIVPVVEEMGCLKVDGATDECSYVNGDASSSVSEHGRMNLSARFAEGGVNHDSTESMPDHNAAEFVPIWLKGSQTKEDAGVHEYEEEPQKVDKLQLYSERVQSNYSDEEDEICRDSSYQGFPFGLRHPAFRNVEYLKAPVGSDNWFRQEVIKAGETYEEMMLGYDKHESDFSASKEKNICNSSSSKSNCDESKDQENSEYCKIDSPRKQRLMHSAFSGLRKVVIRLRLGLRMAGRDETPPAEIRTESDDINAADGVNLLPQSSVGRINFLLGLSSKRMPGRQAECEPDTMYGDPNLISSSIFESATDCEVRDSWDSLLKFRAAQMCDQQFCSSAIFCKQFEKEYPVSDMIFQTKKQLESLRSSLCVAVTPSSESEDWNGLNESKFWSDAGQDLNINQGPNSEVPDGQTDSFTIPTLPRGRELIVNIVSTWGDPHYVGLVGIEMFDDRGHLIQIKDPLRQIRADPPDINVLPGYKNDPRTVDKLVDNVNLTCDDYHVWLTPFTPGKPHLIKISFDSTSTLSVLRFWNYNKSRIHSFRGARIVEVSLDQRLIFVGELRKASGLLADAAQHAEPILFTNNEAILEAVELYDIRYHKETESVLAHETAMKPLQRPDTAGLNTAAFSPKLNLENISLATISLEGGDRPVTHAIRFRSSVPGNVLPMVNPERVEPHSEEFRLQQLAAYQERSPVGQVLMLNLLDTWGDPHYAGLTSIEVLDPDGVPYSISKDALTAKPRDLNDIPGCRGDHRTLDKLVDGCCVSTNDHHMWLIPFEGAKSKHWLRIDLGVPLPVAALKIWNYNKNLDDTCRGVKWLQVHLDDLEVSPPGGHLVRKAPGTDKFDFGHVLPLLRPKHNKRDFSQLEKVIVSSAFFTPHLAWLDSAKLQWAHEICFTPSQPLA